MNAVENQVRELVKVELAAANERFPQFHSQHEGWAVILEEQVELGTEFDKIKGYMGDIFNKIIENNPVSLEIGLVQIHAINAACEAIQVAAMAQKFLEMENREILPALRLRGLAYPRPTEPLDKAEFNALAEVDDAE